jgi:exopolyphosphatase / guanosine-5'-triphosphate,3'-diphosphate pyrophosphatase
VNTAVVDIGTNTLLLLIVDDTGKALVDLCRFGRLGQGLDATGNLAPEAIARSLDICRDYRAVMDEHGIDAPIVIATQAMREAKNASDFVPAAEAIFRGKIEIIGGPREAELAFKSVAQTFPDLAGSAYVVVDVGGGSTEFIVTDGKIVVSAVSVPIGAVRLTERHIKTDPATDDEIGALHADIAKHLSALELPHGVPLVGTAGTATTMAAIDLALASYDAAQVTGHRMSRSAVAALFDRLLRSTATERAAIVGLQPQRADVILSGVAIYARALDRIRASIMITCDRGIRWGIAYEQLGAARPRG